MRIVSLLPIFFSPIRSSRDRSASFFFRYQLHYQMQIAFPSWRCVCLCVSMHYLLLVLLLSFLRVLLMLTCATFFRLRCTSYTHLFFFDLVIIHTHSYDRGRGVFPPRAKMYTNISPSFPPIYVNGCIQALCVCTSSPLSSFVSLSCSCSFALALLLSRSLFLYPFPYVLPTTELPSLVHHRSISCVCKRIYIHGFFFFLCLSLSPLLVQQLPFFPLFVLLSLRVAVAHLYPDFSVFLSLSLCSVYSPFVSPLIITDYTSATVLILFEQPLFFRFLFFFFSVLRLLFVCFAPPDLQDVSPLHPHVDTLSLKNLIHSGAPSLFFFCVCMCVFQLML